MKQDNLLSKLNNATLYGNWDFGNSGTPCVRDRVDELFLFLAGMDHAIAQKNDGKYTNYLIGGSVATALLEFAIPDDKRESLNYRPQDPFTMASSADEKLVNVGKAFHRWNVYRHSGFPATHMLMLRWVKDEWINKTCGKITISCLSNTYHLTQTTAEGLPVPIQD
jgi:hypothetical protein